MGDRLLIGGVAALLAFLCGLAAGFGNLAEALRTMPEPTKNWVTLITGLAWPAVVAVLVLRWGAHLSAAAAHIARRFESEGFDTPWLKMPGAAALGENDATRDLISKLVQGATTQAAASAWLAGNLPAGVAILDFMTQPAYIDRRRKMIDEVLQ